MAKAVTIATRYAAVRRQTAVKTGDKETQVGGACNVWGLKPVSLSLIHRSIHIIHTTGGY